MTKTVGERVRIARQDAKLSVKQLAQKAGMAPSTLYDLERGDQTSTTKLPGIASATGYSAAWLQNGRGARQSADEPGHDAPEDPEYSLEPGVIEEILDILEDEQERHGHDRPSNRFLSESIAKFYNVIWREYMAKEHAYKSRVLNIIVNDARIDESNEGEELGADDRKPGEKTRD